MWIDAWGEAVHTEQLRRTLEQFERGWRAVLAGVLADGDRRGCWRCAGSRGRRGRGWSPRSTGIGLHTTLHADDVAPEAAARWARRLAELELGVTLPGAPAPEPARLGADAPRGAHPDPRARPRRHRARAPRGAVHLRGRGARGVARRAPGRAGPGPAAGGRPRVGRPAPRARAPRRRGRGALRARRAGRRRACARARRSRRSAARSWSAPARRWSPPARTARRAR